MLIKFPMISFSLKTLFLAFIFFNCLSFSKKVDIEGTRPLPLLPFIPPLAIRFVKNPQIQKFFTETHQNWEEVEVSLFQYISQLIIPKGKSHNVFDKNSNMVSTG